MTSVRHPSSLRERPAVGRARQGYNVHAPIQFSPRRCPIPAPDLTARNAECQGTLNKMAVKPDGADEAFLYETKVVFPINNSKEAEELERLVPGAREIYVRATEKDDWKSSITVIPALQGVIVELADVRSGRVAIKGQAEIKSAMLRASKRAVALTLTVVHGGQTEGVSAALIKSLGKAVTFVFDSAQQGLFDGAQPTVLPERGDIVHALEEGSPVWGQVVEINEGEGDEPTTILLNDFGAEHIVTPQDVRSFWKVGQDEATEKALRSFKDRSRRRGIPASWRALTVAVGEAFGAGAIPTDGAHGLTKEIVERAVALAESGFGEGGSGQGEGEGTGGSGEGGSGGEGGDDVTVTRSGANPQVGLA